jgi:chromosome partitioning protein
MNTIAFPTSLGGIGRSSLVYHLAWMFADLGLSVIAVDLDLQSNLTSMFIDDERLETFWPDQSRGKTIFGALQSLLQGSGDIAPPYVENIANNIGLIVGDPALLAWEDELANQWRECLSGKPRAFVVTSAIWRVIEKAAIYRDASLVLIDVGPILGAVNRSAMIAAEHVIFPVAADLYSLHGLRNLGPVLSGWRQEWSERRKHNPPKGVSIPSGAMTPKGYIVTQPAARLDQPFKGYDRRMARIPAVYREAVLNEDAGATIEVKDDPHCLATLKHYRSLMPLAQEARKPMFFLKPSDGALGGHARAVQECFKDFRVLAQTIADRCGVPIS